ncbi:MAG: copper chaperone PCu(A)C [Candidatus Omnitrophica bacterium]|nr:copper chaperone PCu(A)C [Candidatus Omnitrophota bacterium]
MKKVLPLLFGMFICMMPIAQSVEPQVVVHDPWIRWLPGERPNSAAYMTLESKSCGDLVLRAVTSVKVKTVEMHTMDNVDGKMTMRKVKEIRIKPGTQMELKPGGLHLMIFGLPDSFKVGDKIDLTLKFADGTFKTIYAVAKAPQE